MKHKTWIKLHTVLSQATVSLDCDQATMVTQHGKPMFTKVYTEGRLIVEFNFDDLLRIRSWHFAIRNHRELIPRSVIAMQVGLVGFGGMYFVSRSQAWWRPSPRTSPDKASPPPPSTTSGWVTTYLASSRTCPRRRSPKGGLKADPCPPLPQLWAGGPQGPCPRGAHSSAVLTLGQTRSSSSKVLELLRTRRRPYEPH